MLQVAATEFKTRCLHYMDLANQKRETIIITKRGKPIAKLIAYDDNAPNLFGRMKGTIEIKGNIIEPIDTE